MYTSKMIIVMRRDLKMRKGKIAAQAGHACVTAILKALQRDGLLSCIHIEENGAITLPEDLPETPLTAWFTRGEAERSASMWIPKKNCWRSTVRRKSAAYSPH